MTDPSPSERPQLWRRLLLLFLLEWAATLGVFFLLRIRPGFPYLALILLDSALLGLASGLGTRLLLKERHWALRSLAAMAALSTGLFLLGMASGWRYGLGPLEFKVFDLAGAIQLATGLLTSFLAATAWRKPAMQNQKLTNIPPSQPLRAEKPDVAEPSRPLTRRKPKPASGSRSKGRTRRALIQASPKTGQAQKSPVLPPARSRPGRQVRRPEVQIASTQEHRCPYCLEIVQPQDPRGIVECKICHSLHHADCWAITGTCQVPHLNA